nr:retrotransposon Gag domain, retroviral aspartyl protease [Tanacetum cinerariifolium]
MSWEDLMHKLLHVQAMRLLVEVNKKSCLMVVETNPRKRDVDGSMSGCISDESIGDEGCKVECLNLVHELSELNEMSKTVNESKPEVVDVYRTEFKNRLSEVDGEMAVMKVVVATKAGAFSGDEGEDINDIEEMKCLNGSMRCSVPAESIEDEGYKVECLNEVVKLCKIIIYHLVPLLGSQNMVQTRNSENINPPDPIATQLAAIAAKLEVFETMKEDIAALKEGERSRSRSSRNGEGESSWRGRQPQRPYNKIDFSIFSNGDPRGWLMKAEKYFRYYQIPDEEKTVIFWEELVQAFTRSFGLAEFQNPVEFLCSINQTDVRIHKPRTVYSAMSLALEFESKLATHRPEKNASWTLNSKSFQPDPKPTTFTPIPTSTQPKYTPRIPDTEKQNRFIKGECFRCDDTYEPGHLCKTGTLKVLEANEDVEEPLTTDLTNLESDPEETAEISLHAILRKPHPTTMKVHNVLVNELKMATQPLTPSVLVKGVFGIDLESVIVVVDLRFLVVDHSRMLSKDEVLIGELGEVENTRALRASGDIISL